MYYKQKNLLLCQMLVGVGTLDYLCPSLTVKSKLGVDFTPALKFERDTSVQGSTL